MVKKAKTEKTGVSQELLMLGYLCVKDLETLPEMVEVLDRFGFSGPDIAKICNAAEGSIRNARLGLKSRKRNKDGKGSNQSNTEE
ncbi:MAG: hypothetical protein HYZ25_21350 [Chloroflexi bacterium]|nr:hypothetical protein [Chloroflexota bacterium]